jgi:mRNA interferase MazF
MTRLSVVCDPWDLAIVPFPFTDGPGAKRRPALVVSPLAFNQESGHSVIVMITSATHSRWPGDIPLDRSLLGLQKLCVLRMKFFTIDNRLILKSAGRLPDAERRLVRKFLDQMAPL